MKKVAVFGCGIVGTGIAHILMGNGEGIAKNLGEEVELKYVLEKRDCSGEIFADKVVGDIDIILNDPEVFVVAECIGGIGVAYDFIKSCLLAGKSGSSLTETWERGREECTLVSERGVPTLDYRRLVPILAQLLNELVPQSIKGLLEQGRIFGKDLFDYFDALQVGLTATPVKFISVCRMTGAGTPAKQAIAAAASAFSRLCGPGIRI